jgi:protease-4
VGLITLVVAGAGIFFGREHAGPLTAGGRVGVLRIEGVIGQSDDTQYWIDTLKDFESNDRVKAVVLRINSPGGAVGASQEMHEMVAKLRDREHKPVVISMGDVAASGGYYIACAANRIMALRGTLTGSVGVIFSKPQISELTKKIGYETEIVKSGRFKDAGSPTRSMTPQERQMFDYLIDNTFQQFLSDILKFRTERIGAAAQKLSPEKWVAYQFAVPPQKNAETLLRQIADGRVYTGEQALELGLIDEIGTLEDAIAAAGEAAGIGSKPSVYEPKRKRSLQEFLESRVNDLLPQAHAGLQYMMQMP